MDPLESTLGRYLSEEFNHLLNDEELWARFRDRGEEGAFRVFLQRVGGRIFARCRCVVRDHHLAEECFQETFLALIRNRTRLQTFAEAMSWLYTTATNAAAQALRRRQRQLRREVRKAAMAPLYELSKPDLDDESTRAILTIALLHLPRAQRQVLELVYLEGLTHAAAADALKRSRGTVGVQVRRGLERLRRLLPKDSALALGGVASIEAMLIARPPVLGPAMVQAIWSRSKSTAVHHSVWFLGPRVAAAAFAGCAVAIGAGVWVNHDAPAPSDAAFVRKETESLQSRHERLARTDIAPRLLKELQKLLPTEHRVLLNDVHVSGSEIEFDFRTERPILGHANPAILLLRHCVHRRVSSCRVDLSGGGHWRDVNPDRPVIVDLAIPGLPIPAMDLAKDRATAISSLLGAIPGDPRTEHEMIRHLFGEPSGDFNIPPPARGISSSAEGVLLGTVDGGLFLLPADGWWRYVGELPGWFPVLVGGRIYCHRNDAIHSCALGSNTWERVFPEPPGRGMDPVHLISQRDTRLHFHARSGLEWARPLKGGEWKQVPESSQSLDGVVVCGEQEFKHDRTELLTRPFGLESTWTRAGEWPRSVRHLVVVGDRLFAVPDEGTIWSRPAASAKPWSPAGRITRR
jgi:RNA polymerase sigma factor (sigma-70 family)